MVLQTIQVGNLHPLLVHLPIGIILLAFALEVYDRFRPKVASKETILFTLGSAGVAAIASLGTGWLLGEEGGFDEDLLFLHRWMAVAFTVTTILLFFLKRSKSATIQKGYIPVFIIVLMLISATGHFGGSMTHGKDYLFQNSTTENPIIKNVAEAKVHLDIIKPILEAKCISCHNQGKRKGGLLMTSPENLLKGGDSGSIFDTVNGKNPLLHRIHLPLENKEHMPPKGKVQLTPEEIALMEWWIKNGNCFDCRAKDLKTSKKTNSILAGLEEDTSPYAIIAKEVGPVPKQWLGEMNAMGISIYPLAEGNPLMIVNLFGERKLMKEKLKKLKTYAENIVEINLANSQFNDDLADLIVPFKHLTKVQAQNTALTDASVPVFEEFEFLESLNLYGTGIGNAIFDSMQKLPALRSLYLYGTKVTRSEAEKLQSEFPSIAIQHIPKNAFKAVSLSPPIVKAETVFFKDSLEIALESTFEGAAIHYTLDGTPPDSTAMAYTKPFKITQSRTIQAVSTKKGWKPSKISSQEFKTTSVDYLDIALDKPPNEKYKAQKGKTLIDLKRGSTNFVDGAWLGYEGSHFSVTMTLKESKEISTVSVGALSASSNWIFYPVALTVYSSKNGKRFKRIKNVRLPEEKPNNGVSLEFFNIEIPPTETKYVKVEITSPLKNPSWHSNPGGKSWIFIDEIILN